MDGIPEGYRHLYNTIWNYTFGHKNAQIQFHNKLASDNGWCELFAKRVEEEYRKFLFLSVVADHMISPSDEVDQAWHLHQLYSENYEQFCQQVLKRKLYHQPTQGGSAEDAKFDDLYSKTKTTYAQYFLQEIRQAMDSTT